MVLKATNLFAVLFLLTMLVSPVHAKQYDDIVVEVVSPANALRMHGYGEYRISVSNGSLKDRHQVTLILPQQSYFGGTVKRTITVEPASTANVSLLVGMQLSGSGLAVEVDGQPQPDVIAVNFSGYANEIRPLVLISQGASSRAFQTRAGAVLKNAQDIEDFSAAKSETAVGEWSTTWLGYSSFDGIVLTADEMRSMAEPAASALMRYVECGGALLVIGAWRPPQPWRSEKEQDGLLSSYDAGFGVCMVSENGAVEGLTESNWRAIGAEWQQSQSPWASKAALDFPPSANTLFPVTENVGIPVRGLLLIMLVFVILIGPINLLVLSKKKRRMWLLWTVPLISLLTCLAVSAYSLFSEGWGGRARYLSYTILDERSHRASTLGLSAFYTPLTPGDGLRYGTETEINTQWSSPRYSYESGRNRIADWTEDQHLETGWVTARTPAHFRIRRSEARRERLTLTRNSDGSLSVVNGLGVPIRNLRLADEKGVIHKGSDIAAGASAILSKTNDHLVPLKPGALRRAFAGDWMSMVQRDPGNSDLFRPMTYIADLDTCPFLEEGLKGVRHKKFEGRVLGIMKGPGDED